jgi:hypothetical protein
VAPGLRTCDHTVRTEYERALDLAKSHIGGLPTTGPQLPITDVTGAQLEGLTSDQITAHRRLLPASPPRKARARMPTSASTAPAFTPTPHVVVLAAQRIDAQELAADAAERGWIDEADRHRKLIARLDTLIA